MPDLDIIVRGGEVVMPTEVSRADIGIADGRIVVVVAPEINQSTREVIDATGLHVFPGLIDEVRIYNRALSPAEIAQDMNTPIGP